MSQDSPHITLIRGAHNLRAEHRGCVATIGNFDGVHRGHQKVIASLQRAAAERQLPTVVISFEPLPREYFAPQNTPPRLTRWREKVEFFDQLGVDRFLCLPFNDALAGQAPGDFIQQVLVDGLGVKHLVVGDDFRFGRDRAGDFATLQQAGERFGFDVVDTKTVMEDKARISSTRIRQHLERGELDEAAELLGRSYSMAGRVAHGDKRGRIMGYPTANIHIHRQQTPVSGIFVVRMHGLPEGPVDGVASLGVRPTFYGDGMAVLEVHLFDFDRAIYGEHVRVEFLHKIRDEEKFDSMDALIEKIDDDARRARAWFASAR
ncbi:MAG: bifunctional riboflavin kinase/FAD synthetase [Pseudomonadota bacterium]